MLDTATPGHAVERERPARRAILVDMMRSLRSVGDDMSVPQLLTLLLLSSKGPQSVRAVADSLHLRESTVLALCPPLVSRGLALRIPGMSELDGVAMTLSTAGRRFVNNLIYRQGSRSGAFTWVPVTNRDLHRRNNEAIRVA
jgi:DNA-binding MarR family transcriptional regulator